MESLRLALIIQLNILDTLHGSIGTLAVNLPASGIESPADDVTDFDNLDDEEVDKDSGGDNSSPEASQAHASIAAAAAAADDLSVPEQRFIVLPSNSVDRHAAHHAEELKLRVNQADKCLQALRDTIADKSFQYSHVIKVAPRKSVNTRACANIVKLDQKIAFHARVYTRCRNAMARLSADDVTLQKYQILTKEHLRSSAALLNPNEPGSTRLQLSWIWKSTDGGSHQTPDALRECELTAFLDLLQSIDCSKSTGYTGFGPALREIDGTRNSR